jgi:hypothetical protein
VANTVIVSTVTPNMVSEPFVLQATGVDTPVQYSASTLRALLDGLYTPGAFGQSFQVTQRGAGANFSVDVSGGFVGIAGGDIANQGKYLVDGIGVVNVPTPAAPGSGTRIHRIIARVRDKQSSGTYTTYDWTFELLEDTGGGTPATPVSALSLAYVTIASGQASVTTANILDDRVQARAAAAWYAEAKFTTTSFSLSSGNSGTGPDWHASVDPHALWTAGSPGFFTVPFNGKWDLTFEVFMDSATTGALFQAKICRNAAADTSMVGVRSELAMGSAGVNSLKAQKRLDLVAGDKVYFMIYVSTSSTIYATYFSTQLCSQMSMSYAGVG